MKDNADAAFQLRRYAWSAKLPLSIASNFAEFVVFDTRNQPSKTDKASVARIFYCTYRELPEKWEEIASIFSKDAIYKGSFDKFALATKQKKGTAEVDDAFLDEIESWRVALARNIALRNSLTERELNFAVQQTIDRIIFLRIAEARGIEAYGKLRNYGSGSGVFPKLVNAFKEADARYNSGLFHFEKENGRPSTPDALTPSLVIDDKPLKDILNHLYYPESPYEFSVLPADILGQVYERFLGKVIKLGGSGRATIEEKPEVRKAGGVYYTPTHIVSFIVSEAIGPLLKDKSPKTIGRFRVVDPACGSGSFLIGAFDYLLQWHRDQYIATKPESHARGRPPRLFKAENGDWQLTTAERKRILVSHIFGVDIDLQAVEVTKLSLLLRVLANESAEAINKSLALFHERALPDLDENIKCGNSLVSSDFFDHDSGSADQDRFQVNAFEWQREFPSIFKDKGFNAVIGNPPYVDSEWMTRTNPALRTYCTKHYEAASGNWDLFCVFAEKALRLCRPGGLTSMIVPNKLLSAEYASAIRILMTTNASLIHIRDFSKVKVFPVSVYPVVYVCQSVPPESTATVKFEVMEETESLPIVASTIDMPLSLLAQAGDWSRLVQGDSGSLIDKINKQGTPLGKIASVNGAATVAEAYTIKDQISEWASGNRSYLKFLNTGTVDRYVPLWEHFRTRYIKDSYTKPIIAPANQMDLPPRRLAEARAPKIIIGGMTKVLECVFDDGNTLAGKSTTIVLNPSYPIKYVLGILNSKVMTFFFRKRFSGLALEGGFYRIGPPQIQALPIPDPTKSPKDARKLEELVGQIEKLYAELWSAKTPHDKSVIERSIAGMEGRIDDLVYGLFSLDAKDIQDIVGSS